MEIIELLDLCLQRYNTVKKAISRFGITSLAEGMQPFTKMTEQKTLACVFHWITHTMKVDERVVIRIRQGDNIYEVEFKYAQRHLRVTRPTLLNAQEDWKTHSWTEADCFNTLTAERIQASIGRADEENRQRDLQRQTDRELAQSLYEKHPQLMVDEMALIEDFLNVD